MFQNSTLIEDTTAPVSAATRTRSILFLLKPNIIYRWGFPLGFPLGFPWGFPLGFGFLFAAAGCGGLGDADAPEGAAPSINLISGSGNANHLGLFFKLFVEHHLVRPLCWGVRLVAAVVEPQRALDYFPLVSTLKDR